MRLGEFAANRRSATSPDWVHATLMRTFRKKRPRELQRLLDEAEISALMVRYARAVDRIDLDLLRTCYHPDAWVDVVDYAGDVEGFVASVERSLSNLVSTTHFLGNHEVEIDGDVAFSETLCIASLRVPATDGKPEQDITGIVRYGDRLERRGGEWRIAQRVVVKEPGRIDEVVQTPRPWNGRGIREVSPRDLLRPARALAVSGDVAARFDVRSAMRIFRRKRPRELQRLLDEAEIFAVMVRHMRAIDRMDFDLLRTCYHPGAWEDHQPVYVGDVDGFIAHHEQNLPRWLSMTHFLGNHEVEIDGDLAFSETLCLVGYRKAAEDGKPAYDTTGFVRYGTRLERRDGEWRIAHRMMVLEPGRIDEVQTPKPWNGRGIREVSPRDLLRPPVR